MTIKILEHKQYMKAIQDPEAVLVASTVSYFENDISRICPECQRPVYLRPYNAKANKIICLICFLKGERAHEKNIPGPAPHGRSNDKKGEEENG